MAQTFLHQQILVIDDGSTDRTRDICTKFMVGRDNMRLLSFPNGGVAAARNRGTEAAQTPLVAYLDADDLWHPTKLEKQVAALWRHGPDSDYAACYALFRQIDLDGRVFATSSQIGERGDLLRAHLLNNHVGNGSSLLIRRDVALAIGGYDTSLAPAGLGGVEDLDFQLKYLARYRLEAVAEFLVGYRCYAGNMSSNHEAMGGGLVLVTDRHARGPRVGERHGALARVDARYAAIIRNFKAHAWGSAASLGIEMIAISPLATIQVLVIRILRDARRFWGRIKGKVIRAVTGRQRWPQNDFYSYDPTWRPS